MSYFLFGTFDLSGNKSALKTIKSYGKQQNIYFYLDNEIDFYDEIFRMCKEQNLDQKVIFSITSYNQPYNSDDLLFPYDKFTQEELFNDQTRKKFENYCEKNIEILFGFLQKMIDILNLNDLNIVVVEGYDTSFEKRRCSLNQLKENLLSQIEKEGFIQSCIYSIIVS